MTIDIVIEDDRWAAAGIEALAARAVEATLAHLGLAPGDWEVVLLACDDARIAALNADFRDRPQPTNVLSWPSEERGAEAAGAAPCPPDPAEGPELGDIALAFETCAREAEAAGLTLAHHATHLVVHGTLHLLGYDHARDADAALMERTEIGILASLGVEDPY
jgi:probable rRNA maturation factor